MTGTNRKTLKDIAKVPTPDELWTQLMQGQGWDYKYNKERFIMRDRALVCLLYLGCLRVSEGLRVTKSIVQVLDDRVFIQGILLSKSKRKDKDRKVLYRDVQMPRSGDRVKFTELFMEYYKVAQDKLFTFTTNRAWNVVKKLLPDATCHWLRSWGDTYLYQVWDHDIMALADYTKQDVRTLQLYIRKQYEKYPVA